MVATSLKSKKQPRNGFSENIFVISSDDAKVPAGQVYRVVKGGDKLFIFNKNGEKVPLDNVKIKWEERDRAVMIIKVISSFLKTIEPGKVYRVFDDTKNDERYILASDNEKVLFDKNIFKWEVL